METISSAPETNAPPAPSAEELLAKMEADAKAQREAQAKRPFQGWSRERMARRQATLLQQVEAASRVLARSLIRPNSQGYGERIRKQGRRLAFLRAARGEIAALGAVLS